MQKIYLITGTLFVGKDKPVKMKHYEFTDKVQAEKQFYHLLLIGYKARLDVDVRPLPTELQRQQAMELLGLKVGAV